MRFTTIAISMALLGLAACGASSETVRDQNEGIHDINLKGSGTLMAPEANGSFEDLAEAADEDEDYFGEDTIPDADEPVMPVDQVQPRTDLSMTSVGTAPRITQVPAEDRAQPADIGDPRLEAQPATDERPAKP